MRGFSYSQATSAASAATEPPQKASIDVSWTDALQSFGFGLAFSAPRVRVADLGGENSRKRMPARSPAAAMTAGEEHGR
jgi:hypothetical protein